MPKFSTLLDHVLSYGRRFGLDRQRPTSPRSGARSGRRAWTGLETLEPRVLLANPLPNYLTVPNQNVGGDLGVHITTAGITSDVSGALYIASQDATATLYKVIRDPVTGGTIRLDKVGRIVQTGGGAVAQVQALTTNGADLISAIGFDGNSLVPKTNVGGNLGNTFNITGLALSPQLNGAGQQRAFAIDSNGTTLDLYELQRDSTGAITPGGMTKIGGLSTPIVDNATGIPILGIQSLAADPSLSTTSLYAVGTRADQYAPQTPYGFAGDSFDVVGLTVTPSDLTEIDQTFFVNHRNKFTTPTFADQFELYQLSRDPLTPAVLAVEKKGLLGTDPTHDLLNVHTLEADPNDGTVYTLALESGSPIMAVLPVEGNLGDVRNVKAIAAAVVPSAFPTSSLGSLYGIVANGAVTDLYHITQPVTSTTDFEAVTGMTKVGAQPLRDVTGNPIYFVQSLADDPRSTNQFYFVGSSDPTGRSSMFLYQLDLNQTDKTKAVGQWVLSDGITTVKDVVKGLALEPLGLDLFDAFNGVPGQDGIPDTDRFLAVVNGATGDRLISIEIGPAHPSGNLNGFVLNLGNLSTRVGSIGIRSAPGAFGDYLVGVTGAVGDTGRNFVKIDKTSGAMATQGPADSYIRGLTFGNSGYNGMRDQPWALRGDVATSQPDQLWTWFFTSKEFRVNTDTANSAATTGLLFNVNDPTADPTITTFTDQQLRNWQIRPGKTGPNLQALAIDGEGTHWVVLQNGSTQYFGSYTDVDKQNSRFGPLTQIRIAGALPSGTNITEMDFTRTGELLALEQVAGTNQILAIDRENPGQSSVVADDGDITAMLGQDPRGLGSGPLGRFLSIYRGITTSGALGIIPSADNNLGTLTPVPGSSGALDIRSLSVSNLIDQTTGLPRVFAVSDIAGVMRLVEIKSDGLGAANTTNIAGIDAQGAHISVSQPLDLIHTLAADATGVLHTAAFNIVAPVPTGTIHVDTESFRINKSTPIPASPVGLASNAAGTTIWIVDATSKLYVAERDSNGNFIDNQLAKDALATSAEPGKILIQKTDPHTGDPYFVTVTNIQSMTYDGTNLIVTGFDAEISSTKVQIFAVNPVTGQATPAPAAIHIPIINATKLTALNDGAGVSIVKPDANAAPGTPDPVDFNITHTIGGASRIANLNADTGVPTVVGNDFLITHGIADVSLLANLNSGLGVQNKAGADFTIQQSGLTGATPISKLNNGLGVSLATSPAIDFKITRGIGLGTILSTLNGGSGSGFIAGNDFSIQASGLTEGMLLAKLNGGLGLQPVQGQTDFTVSRRLTASSRLIDLNDSGGVDLTDLTLDFQDGSSVSPSLAGLTTITQVIGAINTAGGGKVTASINANQDGLKLIDNTVGGSAFTVSGASAIDLGISTADGALGDQDGAADGTIVGASVFPTYSVSLYGVDTLGAALNIITFQTNGSVQASIAGNGAAVQLEDLDASIQKSSSPLMVRAIGASPVADLLGIHAYDGQGGGHDFDVAANGTILGNPNAPRTTFRIDVTGATATVNDLLTLIATTSNNIITGSINASGSGINLADATFDTALGTSSALPMNIANIGASRVATSLGLVGSDGATAADTISDGTFKGATVVTSFFNIRLAGAVTVQNVIDKINTQTFGIIRASVNAAKTGLDLKDNAFNVGNPVPIAVAAVTGTAASDLGLLLSDKDDGVVDGTVHGSSAVAKFGIDINGLTTIGQLRTAISTQTQGIITVTIDKAKSALVLHDTSFGTQTATLLSVVAGTNGSTANVDLGLTTTDATDSVDGLTADGALVGVGINEAFAVNLPGTDTTLSQIITRINTATGSVVVASVNSAKSVIQLADTSWTVASAFPLTVAALNSSGAGAALGLLTTDQADSVDTLTQDGTLVGAVVSETFQIRLNGAVTVGDVLTKITSQTNSLITPTINATASGLILTDTLWASANKLFTVTPVTGSAAADLGIATTDLADSADGKTPDGVIHGAQISYFTAPHTFQAMATLGSTIYGTIHTAGVDAVSPAAETLGTFDPATGVVTPIDSIWYTDNTLDEPAVVKTPNIIGLSVTAGGELIGIDSSAGLKKRRAIQISTSAPKTASELLNNVKVRTLSDGFTQLSSDASGRTYGLSAGKVWISGSELYKLNESTGAATFETAMVLSNGEAVTHETGLTFQPSTGTLFAAVTTTGRPQLATFARSGAALDGSAMAIIGPGGNFRGALVGEIQANPRDEIASLADDIPLDLEEIQFTTSGALLAYVTGHTGLLEINLDNPFLSWGRAGGSVDSNVVGLSADAAGRFYSIYQNNGTSTYQLWRGNPDVLYISPSNQTLYTISATTARATAVVELKDTASELQKPVGDIFEALAFDPATGDLYAATKDVKHGNVASLVKLTKASGSYTGAFTRVGANSGRIRTDATTDVDISGLAILTDGRFIANDRTGDRLIAIDPVNTDQSSPLSDTGSTANLRGLVADTRDRLLSVNGNVGGLTPGTRGFDQLWINNPPSYSLFTVSRNSGLATVVGTVEPVVTGQPNPYTALAYNSTDALYVIRRDPVNGDTLGTVNATTGAFTAIGLVKVGGVGTIIVDMAFTLDDQLIALDVSGGAGHSRTITINLAAPTTSTSRASIETNTPADSLQGFTRNKKDGRFYSVLPNTGTLNSQLFAGSDIVTFNDEYTTRENTALVATPQTGVLANDTGPSGVGLSAAVAVTTAHGTLTFLGDGSFGYVPTSNYNGTDTFTYYAIDGTGHSAVATVTITIDSFNDAPVNAVPAAQSVVKNNAKVLSTGNSNAISISDIDAGGSTVQMTLTASNGTVTLPSLAGLTFSAGDGTADAVMTFQGTIAAINTAINGLSFTPTQNFVGAASLQVLTNDLGNTGPGGPQSDTDTIAITVTAGNTAPTLTTISNLAGGTQDTPYTVTYASLLAASNLADIDLDTLSFRVEAVSTGTLAKGGVAVTAGVTLLSAGESLVWTPASGASGTLSAFTVKGYDGTAASASAVQVRVVTARLNTAPTLTTISTLATATAGSPFSITYATLAAAANEFDADSDPISFRVAGITSGTLTKGGVAVTAGVTLLSSGETLVWTPVDTASGSTAAFTVNAYDGIAASASPVTVTVTVTPINHTPSINTPAAITGGAINTPLTITYASLLAATGASDIDSGDVLRFNIQSVATGTLTKGGVAITPGVTLLSSGESLVWTPASGASGILNAFVVKAYDGTALSTASSVTVSVNAPPVLTGIANLTGNNQNQPVTISYTTLRAASTVSDANGDAISFKIQSVSSGTLTKGGFAVVPGTTLLSAGQSLVWTPVSGASGLLSAFVVTAFDGLVDSASSATVQVNVTAVNSAPTLTSVTPLTGALKNTPFTLTYATLLAASNLVDPDGGSPSFRVESLLAGSLTKGGLPIVPGSTLLSVGDSFVFTPPTNITGSVAAFTVRGYDGSLPSASPVQVSIVVNVAPTLTSIATLTGATEEQPFTITYASLLAASNAFDANGDAISFRVSAVSSGTLTKGGSAVVGGTTLLSTGESLVWTPPSLTSGTINAFTVKAYDGTTDSLTAIQVKVAAAHVNHAPTLAAATIPGNLGSTPYTFTFNDLRTALSAADPDNDDLGFIVKAVSSGTLTLDGVAVTPGVTTIFTGQSLVWTPAGGAVGTTNAFTLAATDDQAESATRQVRVGLPLAFNTFASAQGSSLTLTYASLLASSNLSSAGPLVFKVGAVSTGTLTKGGVAVVAGTTTIAAGESVVWNYAFGSSGLLNAFTLTASDGTNTFSTPAQVRVANAPFVFDEAFYLQRNPDVAANVGAGKMWASGYMHFLAFGQTEGRRPNAFYVESFYLAQNADVAANVGPGKAWRSGFEHFVAAGQREGRKFSQLFDERTYLALNNDVKNAVIAGNWKSGFEHFLKMGFAEGRRFTVLFDEATYLSSNPDVASAVTGGAWSSGFAHFLASGINENRKYNPVYYETAYLAHNADVAANVGAGKAWRSGLEHYIRVGQFEGRTAV
ncbi:MAG: tandem-95 repeat protein [Planctomycetota bacterium]|nr:tandem-95 repeat protein [Planctomycetota bacterium]